MKKLSTLLITLFLSSCGGSGSETPATTATNIAAVFSLQCDLTANFTPVSSAELSPTTLGISKATVIAVHGKNGAPTRPSIQTLKFNLNAQGYDVVLPYMPWSDLAWSGTLCEGISYLNSLVETEINNGNNVILLGHSMAGPVVLAYSALEATTKPNAITIVAPGHYIHQSSILANAHEPSITLAKDMVSNGLGDVIETFGTYNLGALVDISATPVDYLSFHDISQFPDIEATTPLVTLPILWLAGQDDPLTSITKSLGLIDLIPASINNIYKEIPGNHFTVLGNVTNELDPWYTGL